VTPVPPLAEFLRFIAGRPSGSRGEPAGFPGGRVNVRAVVRDLLESLRGTAPPDGFLEVFRPADHGRAERNRLRWIVAASRLLWHPALRTAAAGSTRLEALLAGELAELGSAVSADTLDTDDERREELVRRTFRALSLFLPGESEAEAADRLAQLDSVERRRILADASQREKRAREVRKAMERKAAEEAAARMNRE